MAITDGPYLICLECGHRQKATGVPCRACGSRSVRIRSSHKTVRVTANLSQPRHAEILQKHFVRVESQGADAVTGVIRPESLSVLRDWGITVHQI